MTQSCKCSCEGGGPVFQAKIDRVREGIERYKAMKGALIPVLHEVQELFGYLPEEALQLVSAELRMPMAEIYGVATFYSFFSLEPKGQQVIRVCLGTACYIKGSQSLLDRLSLELKIKAQETTPDGLFTLDATRCLGACGLAPVLTVDDKVYGRMTAADIPKLLRSYKNAKSEEKELTV